MRRLTALIDALLGRAVDRGLAWWDQRHRLRTVRWLGPVIIRCERWWDASRPWRERAVGACVAAAERCDGFGRSIIGRGAARFWAAHRDAWRWLFALLARPWRRAASPADAGGDTLITGVVAGHGDTMATGSLPDGVPNCCFACAVCSHESMIVGARKYDAFRCPECGTALMIIEAARGLTMVSQAPAAHGRVRQASRAETVETETALPAVEG